MKKILFTMMTFTILFVSCDGKQEDAISEKGVQMLNEKLSRVNLDYYTQFPTDDYYYTKDSMRWAKNDGNGHVIIGITGKCVRLIKKIVFPGLCYTDYYDEPIVKKDSSKAPIETIDRVYYFYFPIDGEVLEYNSPLIENPTPLTINPLENWLYRCSMQMESLDSFYVINEDSGADEDLCYYPSLLLNGVWYTKKHTWLSNDDEHEGIFFGVSKYFPFLLSDIVYVELYVVEEQTFKDGECVAYIEGIRGAEYVYAHGGGIVTKINYDLEYPFMISESQFWLFKCELNEQSWHGLMNPKEYDQYYSQFTK